MSRLLVWAFDTFMATLAGGVAATLSAVLLLWAGVGRGVEGIDLWFCDRTLPWWIARHQALGVAWINGHQNLAPLLGEIPTPLPRSSEPSAEGAPPEPWALEALPALGELPSDSRFAALGVGWPLPAFVRTWVVLNGNDPFPVPAEIDQGDNSVETAILRISEEGYTRVRVRPFALWIDALPWSCVFLWRLRVTRSRRLNRQAAAAAPPAPAA